MSTDFITNSTTEMERCIYMKKIIIVDDEERIRTLVSDFLKRDGYDVIEAKDGEAALEQFDENPDTSMLIIDIMLPNVDGWEVCRRIRKKSRVPILMLSARGEEFDQLTAFECGADDYVIKPFSPSVLVKRVNAIIRRCEEQVNSSRGLELDNLSINEDAHVVYLDGTPIDLTLKEYELVLKMLSSTGHVFTREQLLNAIWGYDYDGDMRTVDSHIARLRTKLGTWGNTHLKTIYGMGYKIEV